MNKLKTDYEELTGVSLNPKKKKKKKEKKVIIYCALKPAIIPTPTACKQHHFHTFTQGAACAGAKQLTKKQLRILKKQEVFE